MSRPGPSSPSAICTRWTGSCRGLSAARKAADLLAIDAEVVTAGQVPAVTMRGITKRFPGVLANDQVDFEVLQGEIHALLGENGAGKSTLSNILTGLYRPDEGELLLHSKPVTFHAPRDAIEAGVGMGPQPFPLPP